MTNAFQAFDLGAGKIINNTDKESAPQGLHYNWGGKKTQNLEPSITAIIFLKIDFKQINWKPLKTRRSGKTFLKWCPFSW